MHYIFSYIPSLCLPHARVTSLEDPVSFSAECPWPPSRTNVVIATTCWDVLHLLLRNIFQRYRSLPLSSACCIHVISLLYPSRQLEQQNLFWSMRSTFIVMIIPASTPFLPASKQCTNYGHRFVAETHKDILEMILTWNDLFDWLAVRTVLPNCTNMFVGTSAIVCSTLNISGCFKTCHFAWF